MLDNFNTIEEFVQYDTNIWWNLNLCGELSSDCSKDKNIFIPYRIIIQTQSDH